MQLYAMHFYLHHVAPTIINITCWPTWESYFRDFWCPWLCILLPVATWYTSENECSCSLCLILSQLTYSCGTGYKTIILDIQSMSHRSRNHYRYIWGGREWEVGKVFFSNSFNILIQRLKIICSITYISTGCPELRSWKSNFCPPPALTEVINSGGEREMYRPQRAFKIIPHTLRT